LSGHPEDEPDVLIEQLRKDEAIADTDTLLHLELMEALLPNAPEPVTSAMRRVQLLTD